MHSAGISKRHSPQFSMSLLCANLCGVVSPCSLSLTHSLQSFQGLCHARCTDCHLHLCSPPYFKQSSNFTLQYVCALGIYCFICKIRRNSMRWLGASVNGTVYHCHGLPYLGMGFCCLFWPMEVTSYPISIIPFFVPLTKVCCIWKCFECFSPYLPQTLGR